MRPEPHNQIIIIQMLSRNKKIKANQWRRGQTRPIQNFAKIALVAMLLLAQPMQSALTVLNMLDTGSMVSYGGSKFGQARCNNGGLMDKTETNGNCNWVNSDPGDRVEWSLSAPINLGSVIFAVHELDMVLSTAVDNFEMYAGPSTDYTQNPKCNDGNTAQNNGVINCVVANVSYITLLNTSVTSMGIQIDEMFLFEEPDFAQRYLTDVSLTSGTVVKGTLSDTIGLGGSLSTLNVQVDFPAGTPIEDRRFEVTLSKILPASVLFFTQTQLSSTLVGFGAQTSISGTWYQCASAPLSVTNMEAWDISCAQPADSWYLSDISESNLTIPSSFYVDTIAIFPAGGACSVSFEATFTITATVAVSYDLGTGPQSQAIDVTSSFKPSWCTFTSSEAYLFFLEVEMTTQFDQSDVTLNFSAGSLTIDATNVALGGTTQVLYMTKDVNGVTTDLYTPIEITITFLGNPCEATPTAFAPAAAATYTQVLGDDGSYSISADNSVAWAEGDATFCGLRTTSYVIQGTSNTVTYATINEPALGGSTFDFDVVSPDATVGPGPVVFTISTSLNDYPSVTETYTVTVDFECPTPNFALGSQATLPLAFTHEFYQAIAPQNYAVSDYDQVTTNPGCENYDKYVSEDISSSKVAYITFKIANDRVQVDVFDRSLVHLVGQTVSYTYGLTGRQSSTDHPLESFTVTFTGPANPECYFTTIQQPSSPYQLYYRFGDGVVTSDEMYSTPTNSESTTISNPLYCGDYDIAMFDLLSVSVGWITASDNGDSSWQLTYDGTSVTEAEVGTTLTYKAQFSLTDFSADVASILTDLEIIVFCPEDGSLIGPATITVAQEMPDSKLIYDVTTLESLEADLSTYSNSSPCQNVTKSYIVDAHTQSEVTFITIDEVAGQISIFTEDVDGTLAGTTVSYLWLIDLTDGQIGVQLAFFEVEYLGQNYPPYFDPPIAGLLQVFKQEEEESWEFVLPDFFDENINDTVTLSVDIADVQAFMSYDEQNKRLQIENLADSELPAGSFSLSVTLSDGTEPETFKISLIVNDLIVTAVESSEEELPLETEETSNDQETDESSADGSGQAGDSDAEAEGDATGDELDEAEDEAIRNEKQISSSVFDWRSAFLKKEEQLLAKAKAAKEANSAFVVMQPPMPTLSFIRETGIVEITFSQPMQLLPSLDMIKQGKIEINGKVVQVFEMRVIPAEGSEPSNLQFEWEVAEMTEKSITLEMTFKQAVFVSAQMDPDILEIIFRDRYLFVGINDLAISDKPLTLNRMLKDGEEEDSDDFILLQKELPQQLQLGGFEEQIQASMESAAGASKAVLASNLILNLLLAASLQHLWSMINTQQLIVMMPLFQISMPANAAVFFSHIMSIAAFDFFELDGIIHELFGIESTEPVDNSFNSVGLESQYFMVNLGTMTLFFLVYLALIALSPILACCGRYSLYWKRKSDRLNKRLFWDSFLTLMNETYMIVIVSVLLNIKIFSTESKGLATMSILCTLMLLIFTVGPVLIICKLYRNFDQLDNRGWRERYGAFYNDLRLKTGRQILAVPSFFLLRRVMLGLAVCIFREVLIYQIMIMAAQIITQIIIIGSGAYQTAGRRRTEFFNEIILMFVLYTVICFSPWISDVIVKFYLGYLACSFVVLHLIGNFSLIFRTSFIETRIKCRKKATVRHHKKQRKLRQEYLKETKKNRWKTRAEKRDVGRRENEAKMNAEMNAMLLACNSNGGVGLLGIPSNVNGFKDGSSVADRLAAKNDGDEKNLIPQQTECEKQLVETPSLKKKKVVQFFDQKDTIIIETTPAREDGVDHKQAAPREKLQHHQLDNFSKIEADAAFFLGNNTGRWRSSPQTADRVKQNEEVDGLPRFAKEVKCKTNQILHADITKVQQSSQETIAEPQYHMRTIPAKKLTFIEFMNQKQETRKRSNNETVFVEEEKTMQGKPSSYNYSLHAATGAGLNRNLRADLPQEYPSRADQRSNDLRQVGLVPGFDNIRAMKDRNNVLRSHIRMSFNAFLKNQKVE